MTIIIVLSLTNLCDECSELVEVAETVWIGTKLTDHLIEPLSPSHRVLNRGSNSFQLRYTLRTVW